MSFMSMCTYDRLSLLRTVWTEVYVHVVQLSCRRFLACARCKLWWMTPEWGSTASQIPPETQFVLLELEESRLYAVLLPLIDSGTWRGTLRPPPRWAAAPFPCPAHACNLQPSAQGMANLLRCGTANGHSLIEGICKHGRRWCLI